MFRNNLAHTKVAPQKLRYSHFKYPIGKAYDKIKTS